MPKTEAAEPEEAVADVESMDSIAAKADGRAQKLLDDAREGIAKAEKALREISTSPVFANGIATGLKEAHTTAAGLDTRLENLKGQIHQHFRRSTKMKEEVQQKGAAAAGGGS